MGANLALENTADAWGREETPRLGQNSGSWGALMTRQNPGPDRAPSPPTRYLTQSSPPSHTDLSYSDRVRNMVRAGESGSGYSGILRANTSPPATNSPTPPHYQGHSPSCACARHPCSPLSHTCLLLVDRSSRRGDWANELTRRASGGPGWAGQRPFFRFKSRVVARGARNWRRVVRVHFFRVLVNCPKIVNWVILWRARLSEPWFDGSLSESVCPRLFSLSTRPAVSCIPRSSGSGADFLQVLWLPPGLNLGNNWMRLYRCWERVRSLQPTPPMARLLRKVGEF